MPKLHDYDKILTRLTIILRRLYEGEILSTSELAKEFNVSTKTIQRDFNERLIRFPIQKHAHKWKMQDGYNLTKERTPEEMLVIEMLENIAQSIGSTFGAKAKYLFSKLQNTTKSPIYSKTIIEDISDKLELFQNVEEAINTNKIVVFDYKDKVRHICPYKIVSFEGYWYLYGEELSQKRLKTFYFKDIKSLYIDEKSFTPNMDNYEILQRALNAWFEPNKDSFEVILNTSSNIAKYFERRPISTTQKIMKKYKDGSMDIAISATSDREVIHEIKKWMPDLTIVEPKELALKVKNLTDAFINKQIEQII
jgi:predicted DNA-binding transcriptional regulator YafY